MPGSSRSRSTSALRIAAAGEQGRQRRPVLRQRLDRAGAAADDAELGDPLDRRGRERPSGAGKARCTSVQGVATSLPKRSTRRRASVRAPATVTCWPSTARTASSKPSTLPGRRRPGAPGSSASAASIASGAASRSSQRRTAAITAPLAGAEGRARTKAGRATPPAGSAPRASRRLRRGAVDRAGAQRPADRAGRRRPRRRGSPAARGRRAATPRRAAAR